MREVLAEHRPADRLPRRRLQARRADGAKPGRGGAQQRDRDAADGADLWRGRRQAVRARVDRQGGRAGDGHGRVEGAGRVGGRGGPVALARRPTSRRCGSATCSARRGSVVPIFRRQIAIGGPVTVTDERMTRYFMTIPEAVQLVIRAGSLGDGGEVYVLEMGDPVSIMALAREMIELSGLAPDEDIAIEIVGRRPGEKLHEELFNDYERPQLTPAEKIVRAEREPLDSGRRGGGVRPDRTARSRGRRGRSGGPRGASFRPCGPRRHSAKLPRLPRNALAQFLHSRSISRAAIKTYGAYAGLAAIIGLAVLSVLYFAQAREVKRLRAWAGRGPERAAEDARARRCRRPEAGRRRADRQARAGDRRRPVDARAGRRRRAGDRRRAAAGAAPRRRGRGRGAPKQEAEPDEATPAPTVRRHGDAAKPDGAPRRRRAGGASPPRPSDRRRRRGPSRQPRTTARRASRWRRSRRRRARAHRQPRPRARTPRTPSRGNGDGSDDDDGGSRRTRLDRRRRDRASWSSSAFVIALSGGSSSRAAKHTATATTPTPSVVTETRRTRSTSQHAPPRASIIVGVLNGTNTTGLAKTHRPAARGRPASTFPAPGARRAADQTHAATIVAYAHGRRASGLAVAKTLGLGSDALTAMDRDTAVQAGGRQDRHRHGRRRPQPLGEPSSTSRRAAPSRARRG